MKKFCCIIIFLVFPFIVFSQSSNNDKKTSKNSEFVSSVEINDSLNNNVIYETETPLMQVKKSEGTNPNLPKEDISTPLMRVIVKKENEEVTE